MVKLSFIDDLTPQFGIVVLNDKIAHGNDKPPSRLQLNMPSELPANFMMSPDFAKD
jgi:hypothetical protein